MYPDRLDAITAAADQRGSRRATHNRGQLHADIAHRCDMLGPISPEHLPEKSWTQALTAAAY